MASSFAAALLINLGCSGGVIDDPVTGGGGSGNIGLGGAASGGVTAVGCYSPTQNLGSAYQPGAQGCSCDPATDESVCVQNVALVCMGNKWMAVEDGPCMPTPGTGGSGNVGSGGNGGGPLGGTSPSACFSPTQNVEGLRPGAPNGCPCSGGSSVCVNGGVGLICSSGHWIAVWDGPCLPGTGGRSSIGTGGSSAGGATATVKRCGARAGDTCSAKEYCAYEEGEYCGAADAEAVCKPRPNACDAVYDPVCGCDNKTYSNSCAAAIAGTGVAVSGACPN